MRFAVSVSMLVLAIASFAPVAVTARATRGLGIPEPVHPLHNKMHKGLHPHPSVTSHQFQHEEDGATVSLHYDVEPAPHLFALDEHDPLERVLCPSPEELHLHFAHPAHQHPHAIRPGALIVGGFGWGCTRVSEASKDRSLRTPCAILRRVHEIVSTDGHKLVLRTTEAAPHEFFKNAKIRYRSSYFPHRIHTSEASPDVVGREVAGRAPARRRLGFLGSFWNHVVHDVEKVVDDVAHTVEHVFEDVAHLAEDAYKDASDLVKVAEAVGHLIFTGEEDADFNDDLDQISEPLREAEIPMPLNSGLSIQCTACGAHAKVTGHFDLDVQDYKLQLLDMSFTGSASFNVAALLSATLTKTWTGKTPNPLFTPPSISTTFTTGPIPWHLSLMMPVYAGYNVALSIEEQVEANINIAGSVTYGLKITPENNFAPQWIHTHNFTHTGDIGKQLAYSDATAQFYLQPTLQLGIDYIGGPYVALRPAIDISASAQRGSTGGCLGIAWGLDASLAVGYGAYVDIHFGSHVIWDHTWSGKFDTFYTLPVSHGCLLPPPTPSPTAAPTQSPTPVPTASPTAKPTPSPTPAPTPSPTPAPPTPAPRANCPENTYQSTYLIESEWAPTAQGCTDDSGCWMFPQQNCSTAPRGAKESTKLCYKKTPQPPAGAKHCANEGGSCSCKDGTVFFGVDNMWHTIHSNESKDCTYSVFGDPAPGTSQLTCRCWQLASVPGCISCPKSTPDISYIAPPNSLECATIEDGIKEDRHEPWVLGQTWAGSYMVIPNSTDNANYSYTHPVHAQLDMKVARQVAATNTTVLLVSYNIRELGCSGQFEVNATYNTDGKFGALLVPTQTWFDSSSNESYPQCRHLSPFKHLVLNGTVSEDSLTFEGEMPSNSDLAAYKPCNGAAVGSFKVSRSPSQALAFLPGSTKQAQCKSAGDSTAGAASGCLAPPQCTQKARKAASSGYNATAVIIGSVCGALALVLAFAYVVVLRKRKMQVRHVSDGTYTTPYELSTFDDNDDEDASAPAATESWRKRNFPWRRSVNDDLRTNARAGARTQLAMTERQRSGGRGLLRRRVEVVGKGAGVVTELKHSIGKPTLHVIQFDDGSREVLQLSKDPTAPNAKGYKYYLLDSIPAAATNPVGMAQPGGGTEVASSDVSKYRVGQSVSNLGPAQVSGTVVSIHAKNGTNPPTGNGIIFVKNSLPTTSYVQLPLDPVAPLSSQRAGTRTMVAALARQQDGGADLVSKRIDVEGKGVGTVTDVHTALGKATQHVVQFDNGSRELLTLCKDPTSASKKGHKFYVM